MVWIYDVGKVVRTQPPEKTYREYFNKILKKMTPPIEANAIAVHLSVDKYIEDSTKSSARANRGENESARSIITGFGQLMPTIIDVWNNALSNSSTKKTLYALFAKYLTCGMATLLYPTTINDEDQTWTVDPKTGIVTKDFECNREGADTRMIYHASVQGDKNVVLVANDSDVMFLGIHACTLADDRHWYYNYTGTA